MKGDPEESSVARSRKFAKLRRVAGEKVKEFRVRCTGTNREMLKAAKVDSQKSPSREVVTTGFFSRVDPPWKMGETKFASEFLSPYNRLFLPRSPLAVSLWPLPKWRSMDWIAARRKQIS